MSEPTLFVALDNLTNEELKTFGIAADLAREGGNFGFKLNLDYLIKAASGGTHFHVPQAIQSLGRPVFVDLKMWNGTRTMADAISCLAKEGVDYLNVYALADNQLPRAIKAAEGTKTKVLGLTVLTHYTEDFCKKYFRRTFSETTRHLAETAVENGCHGIILPGTMLDVVSDIDTIKCVPGVRPVWYADDRHEEEITPGAAIAAGADILVCGSPIMKADDPAEALRKVLAEMVAS